MNTDERETRRRFQQTSIYQTLVKKDNQSDDVFREDRPSDNNLSPAAAASVDGALAAISQLELKEPSAEDKKDIPTALRYVKYFTNLALGLVIGGVVLTKVVSELLATTPAVGA